MLKPVTLSIWSDLIEKLKIKLPDELIEELGCETIFTIPGTNISVDEGTVAGWIIIAVVFLLALFFTRDLKVEGDISKRQLFIEMCVERLRNFFGENLGPDGERYIPWLMTVTVYVGASNMLGVFGIKPPTRSLNVTAALAIMSLVLIEYAAIHKKGLKGRMKSLLEPLPIMLPFNLLDIIIRPTTLCFRLFGNILGAFIVMELLKAVFPIGLTVLGGLYFDIFDGFIQAYVFVFLTSLYIGEALHDQPKEPKKHKKRKRKAKQI